MTREIRYQVGDERYDRTTPRAGQRNGDRERQFLFLDQPSQAYFPPDTSGETVREQTGATNPDRQSVIRMFKSIVEEAKNFQAIVTEHADIRED